MENKSNEQKSLLQRILEQKTNQIARAIDEEITNGAKIEPIVGGFKIDGVLVYVSDIRNNGASVVLNFNSEFLKSLYLSKQKDLLHVQLKEIQEQLKELEHETNDN